MLYWALETFGAEADVVLSVVDEDGTPVPDAKVTVSFTSCAEGNPASSVSGKTDASGRFPASGWSTWSFGWVVEKEGHYRASGTRELRPFAHSGACPLGLWSAEPINQTVELVKAIRPHDMDGRLLFVSVPGMDEEFGFDLVVCDWVPPWGKGDRADMTFFLEDGSSSAASNSWRNTMRVGFPGDGNGVILTNRNNCSMLASPREAPEHGYSPSFESYTQIVAGRDRGSRLVTSECLEVFRIRTSSNPVTGADESLYGKLSGDFYWGGPKRTVYFHRWINAVPGDRNLEDDGRIKYR